MDIKSLGILGLGSRSTLFYIKELNRLYQQKMGGYSTCPFMMVNADFDAINKLLPSTSAKLELVVAHYLGQLKKTSVDAILVPNITLHETIDCISNEEVIIHPVKLTIAKIKTAGFTSVFLLGSLHTMETDYVKAQFIREGISIVLPTKEECRFIDGVRKEIYAETENQQMIREFNALIQYYSIQYPVVLACTELSVGWQEFNPKVFDMARIQIENAIKTLT